MKEMSDLSQFFSVIDCHFQCYNMGRRIYPIDPQEFIDFENTRSAWKTPFLQQAWFAVILWENKSDKDSNENGNKQPKHHVWFLKLPLDEQAKLNLAARDDFLARLLATLENYLTHSRHNKHNTPSAESSSLENAMQDNPYGFQPKAEQLANFHAIVHKHLSLPASSYYKSTQDYFSGHPDLSPNFAEQDIVEQSFIEQSFEGWRELGFQGFADISARLEESYTGTDARTNEQLINAAIPHLPIEPYEVLAACLENHPVSKLTTQAVYNKLITSLEKTNSLSLTQLCISSIRASAQSCDQQLQVQLLNAVLKSVVKTDIEVLATISGRCWSLISLPEILSPFLEALAIADSQHPGAFSAILSDLMFIPDMRETILPAFRQADRSLQLTQAIGTFFHSIQDQKN